MSTAPNANANAGSSSSGSGGGKKDDFVEKSPAGHYVKFGEVIGKGAFKTVFKAQDLEHGNLVAWNEVNIKMYGPRERKRILNEVTLLKKLHHPNLISFYGAWVNKESEKVVFITELMSSGTLKEFCSKYPISCRQIKKYCRDILDCIHYLHTPQPAAAAATNDADAAASSTDASGKPPVASGAKTPSSGASAASSTGKPGVIHRDLKCDNIFIQVRC